MSGYEAYPEYRDSGVEWAGLIPVAWKTWKFKHVLNEKKKVCNVDAPAGSISFGRVVYKNSDSIPVETKASYQEILPGEYLINPLNMNFDLLSLRTALSDIQVVVSTGYIVLNASAELVPRYVRWLLHEFDVAHMKTLGSGVRQTISFGDIGNSVFYEPPVSEQQAIANFLDHETAKIDILIEKQQQLIKLLKEKRQAVISHAVTKGLNPDAPMKDSGVEWLGEVPTEWGSTKMKFCVRTAKGIAFKASEFADSGVPVVKASDIKNLTIQDSDSYFLPSTYLEQYPEAILQSGDIVLSTVGSIPRVKNSAVGQLAVVPESHRGRLLNQNTVIFKISGSQIVKPYFTYCLLTHAYRDHLDLHAHGTANQASLSLVDMLDFEVPVPPTQEQVAIVDLLDRNVEKFKTLEQNATSMIELLKERRTALISAAVTGKIDVHNWQAPESTSTSSMDA